MYAAGALAAPGCTAWKSLLAREGAPVARLHAAREHRRVVVPLVEHDALRGAEEMGSQEGTLLLLRRARVLDTNAPLESAAPSERTTAEAIVQAVGGLPVALDQAGAYIEETGCALTDSCTSTRRGGATF